MSNSKEDLIARIKSKSRPEAPSAAPGPDARSTTGAGISPDRNPWLVFSRQNPQARLRLFLFHYAGGGAQVVYRDWWKFLPDDVEVCAIQLPGRETRSAEAPFRDFYPMIQSLSQALAPLLDEKPYAFFGHCMGALTAFETTRQIRRMKRQGPLWLYVSAFIGPQIPNPESIIRNIPRQDVDEFFRILNGTPKEILENLGLMSLARMVMDADLDLLRGYEYVQEAPLDIPITAFAAANDKLVKLHEVDRWRDQTSREFDISVFPHDHFYIQSHQNFLMRRFNQRLDALRSTLN